MIYFQASSTVSTLTPRFGSFTKSPLSFLIGVHLHLLIQQPYKSKESLSAEEKKKKKKRGRTTECAELLVFNKTWEKNCGRCKNIFFSTLPSLTLQHERSSALLTPLRQNSLFEAHCSFPHFHAVYSRSCSLRLHRDVFFSSTLFISLVSWECSILSPQPTLAACWHLSLQQASSTLKKTLLSLVCEEL